VEDLQLHLVCLSRTRGDVLWEVAFPNPMPCDHYGDFTNQHGYASSTPAVDESGVYVFFGTSGARCYSHGGQLRWQQSCGERYLNFGSAASPVLFENLVIINASVESEALVALEKATGREAWRVPLSGHSYSTPLVFKGGDSPELIYHFGASYANGQANPSAVGAVDPQTGKALWHCKSLNETLNASPIVGKGMIYAIANRFVAIQPGGKGDVTDSRMLWDKKLHSEVGTPVYHDEHLYLADEEGIAHCVRASDGEEVYKRRLEPNAGRVYASGVIGDGKLYYVSREKGAYVLPAEPRFEILAHNVIAPDESIFNATPAISRGQLLLRSDTHLYCIGSRP
jgi:outer membrane protein assembly factor BamB